jgi:hypothetical protein
MAEISVEVSGMTRFYASAGQRKSLDFEPRVPLPPEKDNNFRDKRDEGGLQMVFVLFTLPAAIAGVRLVLSLGNAVADYADGVRGVRDEQKRCRATTGGDPVVVEIVTDATTAQELLQDDRVKRGRQAAEHFHQAGVL